ncbi:hypothetical protein HS088_TW01G00081 [Tripterygium wilfordii]|uniref:Uncharacterized protein n=1 Tax=Tripterygium wilfordii TaxID=458696 RepID=A0A7J7E155_TRIWF|nr:hypothetical protein HS088_TW01G00081 [Tripterygium wilfordii]
MLGGKCANLKWTSCIIKMKVTVYFIFRDFTFSRKSVVPFKNPSLITSPHDLQASVCLSDNAKRRAFDLQRLKNFCPECNRIPYSNGNSPRNSSPSVPKARNPTAWSRSSRILQSFKDIRDRFKEEARVIENCLRTNMGSRIESPVFGSPEYLFRSNTQHKTRRETPIFDPSDYLFQGYPHLRNRIYRKPEHCCFLQRGNSLNYEQGRRRFDSPIFEIRSEITMFKSKSAFIYS